MSTFREFLRDEFEAAAAEVIEWIEKSEQASTVEEQARADDEVRKAACALIRLTDGTGAISRAYERIALGAEPGAPPRDLETTERKAALRLAARMLYDAGNALGPSVRRPVMAVVLELGDLEVGRQLSETGILSARAPGPGRKPRSSLVADAARPLLVRAICYWAGHDGIPVEEAWDNHAELHGGRTFEIFKKFKRTVPASQRNMAISTGRAVRDGHTLSAEQQAIRDEVEELPPVSLSHLIFGEPEGGRK